MNRLTKIPFLTAALFAALTTTSLGAGAFQDSKPAGQQPEQKKLADAAATKASAMSIPLTGVTADNAAKITAAVQAIMHTSVNWKCASCAMTQEAKGQCPTCKKDLAENKVTSKAAKDVKLDPAKGTMSIALAPGQTMDSAELARTLTAQSVTLNERQLAVTAYSKLYIAAPEGAKDAVKKALVDTKLFTGVAVHFNDTKKSYVALIEGVSGSPTYGDTATALEKAGQEYHLSGIAWTAPCEACAKAGMIQAGCKSCWNEPKSTAKY